MTSNRIQNAILRVKIKIEIIQPNQIEIIQPNQIEIIQPNQIEIIQPNQIEMINAAISSHSSEHL